MLPRFAKQVVLALSVSLGAEAQAAWPVLLACSGTGTYPDNPRSSPITRVYSVVLDMGENTLTVDSDILAITRTSNSTITANGSAKDNSGRPTPRVSLDRVTGAIAFSRADLEFYGICKLARKMF